MLQPFLIRGVNLVGMGKSFQVAKFTRSKLSPGEAIVSSSVHGCVGEVFADSRELVSLLTSLRVGDSHVSAFVETVSGDWRCFWRNYKKAFSQIIEPERVSEWNVRGRNQLPWLLRDLVAAMQRGKGKAWFLKDGSPRPGCPKSARVAMRVLLRVFEISHRAQSDHRLASDLKNKREEFCENLVRHPGAHSALAFLMFAWLPCLIHYGMMPAQLLRRARSGSDLSALENLLRLDKNASADLRVRQLIDVELLSGNRARARRIHRALGGSPPAVSEFTFKARVAGMFRRLVRDPRLMNSESIRRVADDVARRDSKGQLRRDQSLGSGGDRFVKAVQRSSILYRALLPT